MSQETPLFKLSPELYKALLAYLESRPFNEVKDGMAELREVGYDPENVISGSLLQSITTFLCNKPYVEVFQVINQILQLKAYNMPAESVPVEPTSEPVVESGTPEIAAVEAAPTESAQ